MSLDQYRSMRRFDVTPEPQGGTPANSSKLRFVIQKHQASHLHYDFRLEIGGVLVSWAVPKGPSLNPDDKRLAMQTEDHPFDYRNFEGTIPAGHYGAGTVMIWDEGTYAPYGSSGNRADDERQLKAALHKGHITFILNGTKLRGEWALIKMHGGEDNAWLLVKAAKDDSASQTIDVTQQDRSARTQRSLNEIAGSQSEAPAIPENLLADTPRSPLPQKLEPMLATLGQEAFDQPGWLFEVKWDGYRALATLENGRVQLKSRGGLDFNDKFPPVTAALQTMAGTAAILDGEIVAVDEQGRSRFGLLQDYGQSGGRLLYYVFDLLYLDGHNLMNLPLSERKSILQAWLPDSPVVRYSDHIEDQGRAFFKLAADQELEGIMAKASDSRYLPGKRSASWIKLKRELRQEAVIGGFTAPRGARTGFGALILGIQTPGGLKYVGHTGGGFTDRQLVSLHDRLLGLKTGRSPFMDSFKVNAPVTWTKPELVCEIKFTEWTKDGRMRHPVYLGLREDKPASAVVHETPLPVEISNPDKIFWPDEGFTKGDLAAYYQRLSPYILPYVTQRLQSMRRYPSGITGSSFFHKDVTEHPDWITTLPVHSDSEDRDIHYLILKDERDLQYMVNLGCIDINPWNSQIDQLDNPDWCVIDLDPEDIGFGEVVRTAQAVHEVLDQANIPSYPKTSGATGIHIFIPLGAEYTYDQCKDFAHIIAQLVHAQLPDTTSLERSPSKRQGKVYLDYLQNRRGQTLAAPYSVRPRPGLPVSAPLDWNEVKPGLDPLDFTVFNIEDRLRERGDLWQPVLGPGIDLLAALARLS